MLQRVLRDPLLHFLLLGALIFALSRWLGPDAADETGTIVVTAEQIAQLRRGIELVQGRGATPAELEAAVDGHVHDEVLYREALAAGLDRDDATVRARLIEKIRFLTENVAEPPLPADAELETWFDANSARFEIPATADFDQVYFDPQRRGDRAESDAGAAVSRLTARGSLTPAQLAAAGDPLPLWNRYTAMSLRDVQLAFGAEFAAALATIGTWQGPVRSRFGWHAVRVERLVPARDPPFAEVRDRVQAAWLDEQRRLGNENRYREMRDRYRVQLEDAPP